MDQNIEYFNEVPSTLEEQPVFKSNDLVATLLSIKDLINNNQIEEAEDLISKLIEEEIKYI